MAMNERIESIVADVERAATIIADFFNAGHVATRSSNGPTCRERLKKIA